MGYYADSTADDGLVGLTGSSSDQVRRLANVVYGFELPTLGPGETVDGVTLKFNVTAVRNQHRLDVYLLDTANPEVTGVDFYFEGDEDTSPDVEFVGDFFDDASIGGEVAIDEDVSLDLAGSSLARFQSFYGGDHTPEQTEVFFRFNLDSAVPIGSSAYYRYKLNTDPSSAEIEIDTIPEPSILAIGFISAIFVGISIRRRP
jgi:hypothetical protein